MKTRCVALVGHRSSGKTSLGDLLLAATGVTRGMGRVSDGSSLLDHEPEERRRRMSLGPSFAWMEHEDHLLHLADTPGALDLQHERQLVTAGCDGAVVVVSASDGVEVGTQMALEDLDDSSVPAIAVVNAIDRPHALESLLDQLHASTRRRVVLLQLPLFDGEEVVGLVSVLDRVAYRYAPDASLGFSMEPVPERMADEVTLAAERAMEGVALTDDALLEHYLEFLELPAQVVRDGLARAVLRGEILPVLVASAVKGIGANTLLEALITYLPSPVQRAEPVLTEFDELAQFEEGEFVAQLLASRLDEENLPYHVLRVWNGEPNPREPWVNANTGERVRVQKLYQVRGPRRRNAFAAESGALVATWDRLPGRPGDTFTNRRRIQVSTPAIGTPMCMKLLQAASTVDEATLHRAVQAAVQMDAGLRLVSDELTGGLLLAGMSEMHVELTVRKLKDRMGVDVALALPPVAYREAPLEPVQGVEGLHHRLDDDGEYAEFAECLIDITPSESPDDDLRFFDETDEEAVPERFRPSIDEGVRRGTRHGPLAGYPVVGLDVRLVGGEYNILQSTDDHFVLAGENAVKNALRRAGTRLLEPICTVDVWTPGDIGTLITELVAHRGRILGMEVEGGTTHIMAQCPYGDLRTFGPRLGALSRGRARWRFRVTHYAPVPQQLIPQIVASSPYRAVTVSAK